MQLFLLSPLERHSLRKESELKQKILATVISVLEDTLAAFVQNVHFLVQMVHILKMYLCDCLSRLLSSETPNTVRFLCSYIIICKTGEKENGAA
jgi:hypothetical protein